MSTTGSPSTGSIITNILGITAQVVSSISFKSIRDKAKAKKALAIAMAGGYDTLTPYQKSLISFNGTSGTMTPENAGQSSLDLSSILIFLAIIVGGYLLIKRFIIER